MSILNQTPLNTEYIKMRFQEPYVTAGLNRKDFGTVIRGVYAGFVIGPRDGFPRGIQVGPGSVSGGIGTGLTSPGYVSGNYDMTLGYSIAVHASSNGFATTIAIPPGVNQNVYLDATGLEGQRVYIAINVSYAISIQTTAQLMLVNSTELDQNPDLLVLGFCDVPVSPVTPLDSTMFGYNDANYPRISPIASVARAGYMSPDQVLRLEQIFPWQDLLAVNKDLNDGFTLTITPSQKVVGGKRIYAYVDAQNTSRFPRDVAGNYNGGPGNDALTTLNYSTGIIGGAHGVSGNTSFAIPSVSGSADSFQMGVIGLNADDEISVQYGTIQSVRSEAFKDQNLPTLGSNFMQLAHFLVETDSSGDLKPLANDAILWRRPFLNLGGGGGLSSKTINIARGFADGTNEQNCTITTVSNKTRVVISGFTFLPNANVGETQGDAVVRVNGQVIERLVSGLNNTEGNVVYEEVGSGGDTVDVYEIIGGSPTPIDDTAQIEVELIQYGAQDVQAISADVLPDTTATRDLGSPTRVWKELWIDDTSIHFVTNDSEYGTLRRNPTTKQLEYRSTPSGVFVPLGGSGIDIAALNKALFDAEAGDPSPVYLNQILDTYASSLGTLTNVTVASSHMALTSGQTTGSQVRSTSVTRNVSGLVSQVNVAARALAPKAIAISGNTIVFTGDITGVIDAGSKVVLFREFTESSTLKHIYLTDSQGKIAQLVVSAASYDMMGDETSVTLTNPGSLDLSLGIDTVDFPTELRVALFGFTAQARSKAADSYEDLDLVDAGTTGTLRLSAIIGNPDFTAQGTITGSILASTAEMSPNGQYGLAKVLEETAGNSVYHFFYTKDSGNTWTKFVTTKGAGANYDEEFGASFQNNTRAHIVVADNGKAICAYAGAPSATLYAVRTDLSVATPVLSDTVATGTDAFNDSGATAGIVGKITTKSIYGVVAGDRSDLSLVVFGLLNGNDNIAEIRVFTNGGASHTGLSSLSINHTDLSPIGLVISGTAPNRRIVMVTKNGSTANVARSFNEATPTTVASFGNIITGSGFALYDMIASGGNIHVLFRQSSTLRWRYSQATDATPGTVVVNSDLSQTMTLDDFIGGSSANQNTNSWKALRNVFAVNPSNPNNIFINQIGVDPDGIRRSRLVEVRDIASHVGSAIFHNTADTSQEIRSSAANQKVAQVFTGSSTRVRTIAVRVGYIAGMTPYPPGFTISAEIQATTAGVPNNTVIATAINSYDTSRISVGNGVGQWLFFRFNEQVLTGQYAIVLTADYAGGSNYVRVYKSNSDTYAGGNGYVYNGTTWSAASAGDWCFEVNSEWIYDVSRGSDASIYGAALWDQETSISAKPNGNLQVISRRASNASNSYLPISGLIAKSDIEIGTGTSASTVTGPEFVGYEGIDENMVFGVSLGNLDNANKNVTTGALTANTEYNDRSGMNIIVASAASFTSTADSDFESGRCGVFNGTSTGIRYNQASDLLSLPLGVLIVLEAEIKPTAVVSANVKAIISNRPDSPSPHWSLWINESGYLALVGTSSLNVVASDAIESTSYHKVRAAYDGTTWRLYRTTAAPHTVFVEVGSYSSQVSHSASIAPSGNFSVGFLIDESASGGEQNAGYFNGKIGYIKMIKRSATFAADGYRNQAPITKAVAISDKIAGEQGIGQNSTTAGVNFDAWGTIDPNAVDTAFADSYEDQFILRKNLSASGKVPHFRIQLDRLSDDDAMQVRGMIARYFE